MTPGPSDGVPRSRLHKLHAATLHLFDLFASHKPEEDLLQKSIESLTALIGARYGAIGILDEAGQLKQLVHAGITPGEAKRIDHLPEGRGLLGVVVREDHVLRLDDISKDPRSTGLPPNRPPVKSSLAAPVSYLGRVYGRVYLSEKTGGEPFNDDDEVLTRHYADALALVLAYHRSQAERGRAEQALREVAQALSEVGEEQFFQHLASTVSKILGTDYAFVGELGPGEIIHTIAFCDHGRIVPNIEYHMASHTPCGSVECQSVCHFPEGARKLYPEDDLIYRYGAEAFIGHPLLDSAGRVCGLLVVMHEQPIADKEHIQAFLQICAGRAAAEIERRRIDRTLNEVAQAVSSVTGEEFFKTLVLNAAKALQVAFAFVGELTGDKADAVRTLAVNAHSRIVDNFVYELRGTPCRNVVGKKPCQYPSGVQQQFSEDRLLAEMNIESYVGYPLFDSAGRPLGLLAIMDTKPLADPQFAQTALQICAGRAAAEIERRHSDRALRLSEEHYHVLSRLAPVGIFRTDAQGNCTYVNQRWCDIAGIAPEQAYGEGWAQAIHPDDRKYIFERWYAMAINDLPFKEECRMQHSGGVTTWVLAQASTERGSDGRVTGYVGTITDITERKQAETEMRKLSGVVEQTADSVLISDRDGVIQYVNPAYEKVTGYTREEAVGKTPSIVKSGNHDKEFYERLWNTISRGGVFRDRFINRRKDGSLYHEEKTITPLKNEKGDITHFVSTGKDVTSRVLAEEENRRTQAFLDSVVENLPNMLFVKDAKDLRFVRFNKAAEELLGYSRDEMIGKNDHDFFTREEADFFISKDKQVLNSGQLQDIPEEPIHTKHKGVRFLHTKKIPILDEAGKPLYLLGISEDITERKTSEGLVARLGRILDNSSNEVYVFSAESLRFIQVNHGARQNLGYTLEELQALTPLDLKPELTRQEFGALVAPLRRGEQGAVMFETVHKRKNGSLYPVEVRLQLSRNETPPVFFAIIQDITERRKTEEVLRGSAAGLANAQRIAHLGNWDWNIVTNELRWSDEIYRIFGLTAQQFGVTYETFLGWVHPDDRQFVSDAVNKTLYEKEPYSIDHRIVRADGTERFVHEQAEVTFDENDKPLRMVGTIQDVTERKQTQERLNHLAHYDTLTGLPNRILLHDRLQQAMVEADRRDRMVAVMFLDLDHFKIINDTLGHDVGDTLLKEVAGRLTACLRASDTISRLGGDEFTVILVNVAHVDDVSRVARKIIDSFISPFSIAGHEMFISASIGIVLYPFDDNGLENLMRNAYAAMYHAKEMGRNTFQFYTAELNLRTAKRLRLETALRHAIERDELLLHFQPQVNLKTGKIIGAEALLRWRHPEMGVIPPLDFIPLAEETGLIIPIGEWALRTACRQARAWHRAGFHSFQVAVNLSGRQFQHRNLAKLVKKVLKETGLDPRHLELELTESQLMHNTGETLAAMNELHALGVAFSMDDFGTGYSSLSYLKRFPIDTLKIDRSFVRDIPADANDAAIAQAIIAMAHSLEIKVIAEGVETAKQLAFMRTHKCDGMQGYYFSKPVPAEAMTGLLQKDHRLALRKPATLTRKSKRPRAS